MDRFDTIATGGLAIVGMLVLLTGIGTLVYAIAVIQPNLEELHEQGLQGVELAERGLEVLDAHSNAIAPLNPPQSNTLATMQELPAALAQSATLSRHAAEALSSSANTLRQLEEDLGIVLPDNALRQNAEALATSAQTLRGFSPVLYELHEQTDTMAADLTRASQRAERLQDELQNEEVTIEQARMYVQNTREAVRSADLPAEITRLIGMVGGLFIVLGVTLLGLAGLWRRIALLSARSGRIRPSK